MFVAPPLPKFHCRFVIVPKELSVKVTASGGEPERGVAKNEATGPGGTTAVTTEAKLLAAFGSLLRAEAVTMLVTYPGEFAVMVIVMVARAPLVIVPRAQATVPLPLVIAPSVVVAETSAAPGGSISYTNASEAMFGPRFVTLIV